MTALVYVETNWVVGAVMGQDALADELLIEPSVHLLLPSACIMEAIKSFEGKRRDRHDLNLHVERQLAQVSRSLGVPEAVALTKELQEARIENDRLLNALYRRLDDTLKGVVERAELIDLAPDDVIHACDLALMAEVERADMLVLSTVVHDAARRPDATKAFLTGDRGFTTFRSQFEGVGLKLFGSSQDVLAWARSDRQGA